MDHLPAVSVGKEAALHEVVAGSWQARHTNSGDCGDDAPMGALTAWHQGMPAGRGQSRESSRSRQQPVAQSVSKGRVLPHVFRTSEHCNEDFRAKALGVTTLRVLG